MIDKGSGKPAAEIEELTNRWKRALADYQNLEKRGQAEKASLIRFANEELILKLLPVLDSLEKAAEHLTNKGLDLILKQLRQVFEEEGLEEIVCLNQKFDPSFSECLEVIPAENEDLVAEIIQKGYKLNGRVIRPAKVKVTGKKINEKAKEL